MNKWTPERKVIAGGGLGMPLAVILAWVLNVNGIIMPPEVAAATGSVLSTLVAYLMPQT